jgi:hypothetical protein
VRPLSTVNDTLAVYHRPDSGLGAINKVRSGEIRPFEAAPEASYLAANAPTVVFGPGVLVDEAGPVAHTDRRDGPLSNGRGDAVAVVRSRALLVGGDPLIGWLQWQGVFRDQLPEVPPRVVLLCVYVAEIKIADNDVPGRIDE